MILSKQSIIKIQPVAPFVSEKRIQNGMSYGLSGASYDVRIGQDLEFYPDEFHLASTLEHFCIPSNVSAMVLDKSSWARLGLSAFNTYIDPGFVGYMTLELVNNSINLISINEGDPICQIVFFWLDGHVDNYNGKYQNQPDKPVEAIREAEDIGWENSQVKAKIEADLYHPKLSRYQKKCYKNRVKNNVSIR